MRQSGEETYIKYLNELKVKYAPPRKITSKKQGEIYDMIRNTNLSKDSKLILEIPESNRSFADIDKYIKIANENGITLRFRPE